MNRRTAVEWLFGLVSSAVLLASPLGCATLHDDRLGDCDTQTVRLSFKCPQSSVQQLVLGTPKSYGKVPFAGNLHVTEKRSGRTLCRLDFTSDTVQGGNWLDNYDLNTAILTWENEEFRAIKRGTVYEVTITFTEVPPEGSSLWLCWVKNSSFKANAER